MQVHAGLVHQCYGAYWRPLKTLDTHREGDKMGQCPCVQYAGQVFEVDQPFDKGNACLEKQTMGGVVATGSVYARRVEADAIAGIGEAPRS